MAYICENVAWNEQTGIGVDTHMHRLFHALGWVQSKTPEQTRLQLEAWLPKDKWAEVNLLWVVFGQEVQQFKPKILRKALDCSIRYGLHATGIGTEFPKKIKCEAQHSRHSQHKNYSKSKSEQTDKIQNGHHLHGFRNFSNRPVAPLIGGLQLGTSDASTDSARKGSQSGTPVTKIHSVQAKLRKI